MPRFQMSSPDLAVAAVDRLTSEGYEAAIDVPAEDDVHSFVSAWLREDGGDVDRLHDLVHMVDPEAIHTGEESDAGTHPDVSTE
jgi:hypothetical protein